MTRSLFAGMTEYSHQSFEDLIEDLNYWKNSCLEKEKWIDENISRLESSNYWEKVPFNVKAEIYYSKKYFKTVISEIESIVEDLKQEVQNNHVNRLISLANTASRENKEMGYTWHSENIEAWKDYENENYKIVENLYSRTRDLITSLTDLSNIGTRLEDFIGKKTKNNNENLILNAAKFGDNATINVGNNNVITTQNIKVNKGNFEELSDTLIKSGVDIIDIENLKRIIEKDEPNIEERKFGAGVSDWIGQMISKAAQNIWEIGIGAAGSLLAQALNQYYGWI